MTPIGFWSDATRDDSSSRGRLRQLRTLQADALQSNIGRPKVHIFQDVAAIPYGANSEKEIRQALDESSMLTPIITPAFPHSECLLGGQEVEAPRSNRRSPSALGFRLGKRHTLVQLGQRQLDADLGHGEHRIT